MSLDQAFNWTRPPAGMTVLSIAPHQLHAPHASEERAAAPVQDAPLSLRDSPRHDIGDFYVAAGSLASHPPATYPPLLHAGNGEASAGGPGSGSNRDASDAALLESLSPVFQPDFLEAFPRQAARTLIALVSQPGHSSSAGPFRTRDMSCDARKKIIAKVRDADNRAFWGALIDETEGRLLLASWLRETLDRPEIWAATRMPLLRLMENLPMLKRHILDDATNHCMGKAIGAVVKRGQEKSKKLAADIRQDWSSVVDDSHTAPRPSASGSGGSKRLAVEVDDGARKKSKLNTSSAAAAAQGPKANTSDTMQTLNSLSQSSAYLSATTSLAGSAKSTPSSSKLVASGSDRSSDLSKLAKKTVTRTSADVKEVCPRCKTTLIPGVTSTTRVKASLAHGRRIEQVCLKCNEKAKKTPAPPTRPSGAKKGGAFGEELNDSDSSSDRKAHNKAPVRRANASKDMFSDLISKPAPSSLASRSSNSTSAATTIPSGSVEDKDGQSSVSTSAKATGKKGKRVRWRDDNLVEVKLIENISDIDADLHASVEEYGLQGLEMGEGQALRGAHMDLIDEEVEWSVPVDCEASDPAPDRGTGSEEAKAQEQREKSVLSAIYMDEIQIPASATEASEMASTHRESGAPKPFGLPEGWESTAPPAPGPPPNISDLMRQLAGDAIAGHSHDAATSLESLGISKTGLQGLLASIGPAPPAPQQQQQQHQHQNQQHQHPQGAYQNRPEHGYPYGSYQQGPQGQQGGHGWGGGPPQWQNYSANPYR
ncbi:unnamed protein product [Parajaminaea phylloscopi]